MPIHIATPPPTHPPAPDWYALLTDTMRKELLGWLRVRHVDTAGWVVK